MLGNMVRNVRAIIVTRSFLYNGNAFNVSISTEPELDDRKRMGIKVSRH